MWEEVTENLSRAGNRRSNYFVAEANDSHGAKLLVKKILLPSWPPDLPGSIRDVSGG
jgi:hypothetical protein